MRLLNSVTSLKFQAVIVLRLGKDLMKIKILSECDQIATKSFPMAC